MTQICLKNLMSYKELGIFAYVPITIYRNILFVQELGGLDWYHKSKDELSTGLSFKPFSGVDVI